MTYSYQMPISPNGMNYPTQYNDVSAQPKSSSAPFATAGVLLGGGIGAVMGYKKSPIIDKSGNVPDSFAQKVYNKVMKNSSGTNKNIYKQSTKVIDKLNSTSSVDRFKKLLNSSPDVLNDICADLNQPSEEFLQNITADNLTTNKKVIKDRLNAANKNRLQNMKNQIQACWNKDTKKFEQVDSVKEEVYKAIKSASMGMKAKIIAKYMAIGAAITGVFAYAGHKLLTYNK